MTDQLDLDGLERRIGRALDRNGLRERGWSEADIDAAMGEVATVSPFSKSEAKIVMPIVIDAINEARSDAQVEIERLSQTLRHIAGMDCYTREGEEPVHLLMMRLADQALAPATGGGE